MRAGSKRKIERCQKQHSEESFWPFVAAGGENCCRYEGGGQNIT